MERRVRVGMRAVDARGREVGEVTECRDDGFRVRRGAVEELTVPYAEVVDSDGATVRLRARGEDLHAVDPDRIERNTAGDEYDPARQRLPDLDGDPRR